MNLECIIRKIVSSKFYFVLAMFLYRVLIDICYIKIISPYYAYSGLFTDMNTTKLFESYIVILIYTLFLDHRVKKPSAFFILYLFSMLVIPLSSVYALQNQSREYFYMVLLSFILIRLSSKIIVIKIRTLKDGQTIAILTSIIISIVLFAWIISRGGLSYLNFNLLRVYDFRRTVAELVFPGKLSYLMVWFGDVINPSLIAFSLWKNKRKAVILTIGIQILFFAITAHKSMLFNPILIIFVYLFSKKQYIGTMIPTGLAGVTLGSSLYYWLFGELILVSLFVRRAMYVVANNHYRYYNAFKELGFLYFSNKSWFPRIIEYPFDLPIPRVISMIYNGDPDTWVNTGFLATGYMNFGILGMLIYSFIVGIIFRYIDYFAEHLLPMWVCIAIMIVPVNSLLGADLPTALLTHGICPAFLMLWLISSKPSKFMLRLNKGTIERDNDYLPNIIKSVNLISRGFIMGKKIMTENAIKYTIDHLMAIANPNNNLKYIVLIDSNMKKVTTSFMHSNKSIQFNLADDIQWTNLVNFNIKELKWVENANKRRKIPVLFWGSENSRFIEILSDHKIIFNGDIISSVFFMLSRWEEAICNERDEHGRFMYKNSIAYKYSFIDIPIVDEYCMLLRNCLKILFPKIDLGMKKFRFKVSHDIDHIRRFKSLKSTVRTFGRDIIKEKSIKLLLHSIGDFLISYGNPNKDPYLRAIYDLAKLSAGKGFQSAFYFKTSLKSNHDSGYVIDKSLRECILYLKKMDHEVGFHPGYYTYKDYDRFIQEKKIMDEVLGNNCYGGRQHYLRFDVYSTWKFWEKAGLIYDSTVGYAEQEGFRCGTCHPFQPYDIEHDRVYNITEIPLIVMEGTLKTYRRLTTKESVEVITDLMNKCKEVEGVFTLLWHNTSVGREWEEWFADVYKTTLDKAAQYCNNHKNMEA